MTDKDNSYCNNDGNDCIGDVETLCDLGKGCLMGIDTFFLRFIDDAHLDENDLCFFWPFLQNSLVPFPDSTNCIQMIYTFDVNGDHLISYHEAIIAYATHGYFEISVEKAKLNCESCDNPKDFY